MLLLLRLINHKDKRQDNTTAGRPQYHKQRFRQSITGCIGPFGIKGLRRVRAKCHPSSEYASSSGHHRPIVSSANLSLQPAITNF